MLPELNAQMQSRESQVSAFLGIHYGEGPSMGQAEETQNLSTARFPALCTREGRAQEGTWTNATGIYYRGGLLTVAGSKLYFDGVEIGDITPGEKQFATVNSKIVIFPDKVMVDSDSGEITRMEAQAVLSTGAVTFRNDETKSELAVSLGAYYLRANGTFYPGPSGPSTTQQNWRAYQYPFGLRTDGTYKITDISLDESSGTLSYTKKTGTNEDYYGANAWKEGETFICPKMNLDGITAYGVIKSADSYVYISGGTREKVYTIQFERVEVTATGFTNVGSFEALGFRAGDTIEITGCTTHPENNKTITIRETGEETIDGKSYAKLIFDANTLAAAPTEAGTVSIRRKVPSLSLICESGNRLWGVEGNTIFGSALGDPTNFYTYDGLDTDSFAVAVASDGAFTAAVPYGASVLFFKEDALHKLLGDYPSNYQVYDSKIPGVKRDSAGSVCRINEVVYYHGREGVYQYAGGTPKLISQDFGPRRYEKACAGALGDRYYISMKDLRTGAWGMWVYDIQNRLWLREDGTHAAAFASGGGKLWYLDGDGTKVMCATPDTSAEVVDWSVTLDRFDERLRSRNAFVRLILRAEVVESTGWLQVEVSTDKGPWRLIYPRKEHWTGVCVIPIIFPWCDGLRIRISGQGKVMLHSITRETGQ